MSLADELLNSVSEETTEEITGTNIVIGTDRFITVPDSVKKIAVQYDHDIETVTFDCPRYWDGRDLSTMRVYINYLRPDGVPGSYLCESVTIDEADENTIHFDWVISSHVTYASGNLSFLVCIKNVDTEGTEINHWNSELNNELYISTGMKCIDPIIRRYPDIITQLLIRMDNLENFNNADEFVNALKLKADNTTVDANFKDVNAKLDLKANADSVSNAFEEMNTQITEGLKLKANAENVNASIEAVNTELNKKADTENVNLALEEINGYLNIFRSQIATLKNEAIPFLDTINLTNEWSKVEGEELYSQNVTISSIGTDYIGKVQVNLKPTVSILKQMAADGVSTLWIETNETGAVAYCYGAPLSVAVSVSCDCEVVVTE